MQSETRTTTIIPAATQCWISRELSIPIGYNFDSKLQTKFSAGSNW
jgi:hypothetical protein